MNRSGISLAGCVLVLGAGLAMAIALQAASPTATAPATQPGEARLQSLREAVLRIAIPDEQRKAVESLFDTVEREVTRIAGKPAGLGPKEVGVGQLEEALNELVQRYGPSVAAAVFFDNPGQNYARFVTLRMLAEFPAYGIDDLPLLVNLYLARGPEIEGLGTSMRRWISYGAAKMQLTSQIAAVLNIDWHAGRGREDLTSMPTAYQQPRVWLRAILQEGLSLPANEKNRRIISNCLVTL